MEDKPKERGPRTRNSKRVLTVAAILLITIHLILLVSSARQKSHTSDEPFHLARGMAALLTGDFRTSVAHPPLVNMLSALPGTLAYDFQVPVRHPVWTSHKYSAPDRKIALARHFLYRHPHYIDIVLMGRVPTMVLSALLAIVLGIWAARLFGPRAAVMAMAMYCFSPTVLAHARLSTTDTGCALFTFMFAFLFCSYLRYPRYHNLLLTGVALGLALLSKYTSILLIPVVPIALVMERKRLQEAKRELRQTGARTAYAGWIPACLIIYITGCVVLWAGYGFEVQSFHELSVPETPALAAAPGLFMKTAIVKVMDLLNLPPQTYFFGLSTTLLDTAAHPKPLFFLGEVSNKGWWYYYPVLFVIKEPVALLVLIVLGTVSLRKAGGLERPEKTVTIVVAVIFLGAFMLLNQKNIGIRHLLPLYPFLLLWLSRLAEGRALRGVVPWGAWLLVAALVVRAIVIHPDYLVHFNRLVGGPEGGLKLSVVGEDWGQDVSALGNFCQRKDIRKIYYKHYGMADPGAYGVPYEKYECNMDKPGWYAIHVVTLRRSTPEKKKKCYQYFLDNKPEAKIHHTIYVYYREKEERSRGG